MHGINKRNLLERERDDGMRKDALAFVCSLNDVP